MPPTTTIGAELSAGPLPRWQWTQAELVQELRRLDRRGVRITSKALLAAGQAKVLGAIQRLVGSIVRARELAQLSELVVRRPATTQHWSTVRVVQAIRMRHITGQSLASSRVPTTLRDAAVMWCGSWREAITMAGLDYAATRVKPMARSKRQVGRELRALARAKPQMTRSQLRHQVVGVAAIRRYGSLDQALEAARIEGWPRRRRRAATGPRARPRPPEQRRTLSRVATEGALGRRKEQGLSFVISDLRRDEPDLLNGIRRHFGSINDAREFVGLPAKNLRWTPERVVAELRARHRAGKSMAPEVLLREAPALYRATRRKMGAVGRAVAAVAPEVEDVPIGSARRVMAMIRVRKRTGKSLHKEDVPSRLRGAARRFFGTWQAALAQTGLVVEDELAHRTWTDDELLAALRALAHEQPALTVSELHRSRVGSTAANRFGTLAAALRRAGLTRWPRRLRRPLPGRDDVVRLLRQRQARGDTLSMPAARRDEPRLLKAALKHFGTWRAALAAAGVGAAGTAT